MSKYKKLLGNSLIFAIGNLGSKFAAFLLVPFYTYYLTTSEFGTIDIVVTTINMLLPIVSLSIFTATLRFVMDQNKSYESVVTNSLAITIIGAIVTLLTYPIIIYFNIFNGLASFLYIILILQAFQSVFAEFSRAIGKVKVYALNGIIQTIVLGISNILFIAIMDKGIDGYFISLIITNIVSIIFLSILTNIFQFVKLKYISYKLTKKMLIYSIPLIPNSIMWWLMNASNRYFILSFEGKEINGLYAVASRIPTLLTIFTSIFNLAWQLSAIEEFKSKEKSKFYSQIFNYYQAFLLIGTSMILVITKPINKYLFASEYFTAWEYVPFLLLGVVFSSYSSFVGTNYIAAKDTKGVFFTSLYGGILSIILNLSLVPTLGGIGAGLATMFSFLLIWILRIKDTRKYIEIRINFKLFNSSLCIIILQIIIMFLNLNIIIEFGLLITLFIIILINNKKVLLLLLQKILNNKTS